MDNKQTSFRTKLTPVQLQQRLIYTQSELKKYKAQVEKYQNDYYYNMIDELKEKEQAWVLERDELQQNLVTANETIQLLQDELTTLKTQEKADHSSAPKGKKEIPMPTQNTPPRYYTSKGRSKGNRSVSRRNTDISIQKPGLVFTIRERV